VDINAKKSTSYQTSLLPNSAKLFKPNNGLGMAYTNNLQSYQYLLENWILLFGICARGCWKIRERI